MDKITNEQKYKTADERIKAFDAWCREEEQCKKCGLDTSRACAYCFNRWLALEADEKPESCPFCHRNVTESMTVAGGVFLDCKCGYRSEVAVGGKPHELKLKAIAAHNRVARAVLAAEKGEVK